MSYSTQIQTQNSLKMRLKLNTQTQYSNSFFFEFPCMIMTHIRPNKKISKYDQINVKIDQQTNLSMKNPKKKLKKN